MRHVSPSSSSPKPGFAVKNRVLLGLTSVLMVVGAFGFYVFSISSPTQQKRIANLQKGWQNKVTLTNIIHLDNLKKQENYEELRQKGVMKGTKLASLSTARTKVHQNDNFLTITETAPSPAQLEKQTEKVFSTHAVTVSRDQPAKKVKVAFKPMANVQDIEANLGDDDDSIESEIVESVSQSTTKTPKFAIQLITSRSLYVIEEKWYELKEADHSNLLDELQPRFTAIPISKGKTDYTLLAGPIQTPQQAVELCKKLTSLTEDCSETIFKGETLFQSENTEDFPVGSIGVDGSPKIR